MPRWTAITASLAVLATSVAAIVFDAPAAEADAPVVTLSVSGDTTILAGDTATYSLSAHNSSGTVDGFNLAFVVDIPEGVTFASSSLGAPTVYDDVLDYPGEPVAAAGFARWVWEDAADLPHGADLDLTLTVHPEQPPSVAPYYNPSTQYFPVGSSYTLNSTAYLSSDARYLPVFVGSTGVGGASAIAATVGSTTIPKMTSINAITISKSEPSPEAELLRGVHDQTTVYTLDVQNNKGFQTSSAIVVDYVPAGLEFLGCGTVDNGIDQQEYSGSADLTGTPALSALSAFAGAPYPTREGCLLPVSVDTVEMTGGSSGSTLPNRLPDGVYTMVTWNIGDLPAGSHTILHYRAAVPLYENTVDWDLASTPGVTEPTPSTTPIVPGTLAPQAANLDNNTGPSTRQGTDGSFAYDYAHDGGLLPGDAGYTTYRAHDDGDTWTNRSRVDGHYDGVVRAADATAANALRPVFDESDATIFAMDLSVLKSAGGGSFTPGDSAPFSLTVRTGEYATADTVVLHDTVRNGLCPLVPAGTPTTVVGSGAFPTECRPDAGALDSIPSFAPISGATVANVTYYAATGRFTMTLHPVFPGADPGETANDATHTITYSVLMRDVYELSNEYGPTTSGDSFLNSVEIAGATTNIPAVASMPSEIAVPQDVWDDSSATVDSDFTTIDKQVLPRDDVTNSATPCAAAVNSDWVQGVDAATTPSGFRMGDTVCYRLTVNFPNTITTRNPIITDFLPVGLSYAGADVASSSTVPSGEVSLDASLGASDGRLDWTVGTSGAGGDKYVAAGQKLQLLVWATITAPAAGSATDKPENLMKYRQVNVLGDVYFLRDAASIEREPTIGLLKGVRDVDNVVASTGNVFDSNVDNVLVTEGQTVTYRIDLTGLLNAVNGVEVWDALPPGIDCADVSNFLFNAVTATPTCTDNVTGLNPSSLDHRSVVKWSGLAIPAAVSPATRGVATINYDVLIPAGTSVETTLPNTASIVSFDSSSNGGGVATDYPTGSMNPLNTANFPGTGMTDNSSVYLPPVSVSKTATSDIVDSTNKNTAVQGVIGEIVTYTYTTSIPAHTTVYNATFTDPLPTGLTFYAGFTPTATLDGGALPGGFSLNTGNGTLTFPTTYDNSTSAAQVFAVTIKAFVANVGSNTNGTARVNTATFRSTATSSSGSSAINRAASATITVITPSPVVTKTVTTVDGVAPTFVGGKAQIYVNSVVGYTITVTNSSTRPTSNDTVVSDCVPSQLTIATSPAVAVTPGTTLLANSSCTGGTQLNWSIGAVNPGATFTLTYSASVDLDAAGQSSYTNTANLTGYSLPAGPPSGVRATYTSTSNAIVQVYGATVAKTATNLTTGVSCTSAGAECTGAIGNSVRYTLTTTLPKNVNFYDATLQDVVPKGIKVVSSSVTAAAGLTISGPTPSTTTGTAATTMVWLVSDGLGGGDIPYVGSDRTITITYDAIIVDSRTDPLATPTPIANNTVINKADFLWNVTDGDAASRVSSADAARTFRIWEPNLSIVKKVNSADAINVQPGGPAFTYSLTASNANTSTTSTAYDVVVKDVVPEGIVVNVGSISPAPFSVTAVGVTTEIVWHVASIAKNASQVFSYTANIAASSTLDDAQVLTNTASIPNYYSTPSTDPNVADRRGYVGGSDTATVTAYFPVVSVTKTSAAGPSYINSGHTFTVVISNTSTVANAYSVHLADTLPTGWVYVTGSAAIGATATPPVASATDPQVLDWANLGGITHGTSITLTYQAKPDPAFGWDATNTGASVADRNTVSVDALDGHSETGNESRTYAASAFADAYIHRADLALTKSHSGSTIAGDASGFNWVLHVSSLGPDPEAGPISVTDTLPNGVTYTGITGTGWSVASVIAGVYTFSHAGPLASGASLPDLLVHSTIAAATANGTVISNSASVSGVTFETVTANNTDDDDLTVAVQADLGIVKVVSAPSFVAGQDAHWTITVTNHGPSVSRGPITVTDSLPAGIGTAVASGTGWVCGAPSGGAIVCTFAGDLASSATAVISVTTPVLSATTAALYNTGTVVGTTPEPTPDVFADTSVAAVNPLGTNADLELSKSIVSPTLPAGGTGRYRLDITNHGPSDALMVTVVDNLPAGLTFAGGVTSDSTLAWTCVVDPDPTKVDCSLGGLHTMVNGASTWLEFDVHVGSGVFGTIDNAATVSSTTPDSVPANNTDHALATAVLSTNVSISKQTTATVLEGGDTFTYTIQVANSGTSDVANLYVGDQLASVLKFVGATLAAPGSGVPAWTSCSQTGQDGNGYGGHVRCDLSGNLPSGASAGLITLTVQVAPEAYATSVTNDGVVYWTDLASAFVYEAHSFVDTPLKWIHYSGASQCRADVPFFDYDISTSASVDSTLPVTIQWFKDSNGDGIPENPTDTESDPIIDNPAAGPVATYTLDPQTLTLTAGAATFPVTSATTASIRTLSGSVIWPGAAVDSHGNGIAWPGWRIALQTETPTWENLIYDETLLGANLRAGALIVMHVNPTTSVRQSYPPTTLSCTLQRLPTLDLTKTASIAYAAPGAHFYYTLSVTNTGLGATNNVVLVDHVPSDLRVTDVVETPPADPTIPAWNNCTVSLQNASGYGGDVTCALNGYLGYLQTAPDVTVEVQLTPTSVGRTVMNHASVWWSDPDGEADPGLQLATEAINEGFLAHSGFDSLFGMLVAIFALLSTGVILIICRPRRDPLHLARHLQS